MLKEQEALQNIEFKTSDSVIVRYYDQLKTLFSKVENERINKNSKIFEPAFKLPELNEDFIQFYEVAQISLEEMGKYQGKKIQLLNLIKNPNTQTTKTLASLLMVARAINHINESGKGILIFTPSSGNKATALRDAVERAIKYKLVDKTMLRIITLTPSNAIYKLRETELTTDPTLALLNPVFSYKGTVSQDVKAIGKEFIEKYGNKIANEHNLDIWYSLDILNYKVADAIRAFYDYEFSFKKNKKDRRLHAHSVSSAYGLLGFNYGQEFMEECGIIDVDKPGYLLIQHASTSDMVLNLLNNSFSQLNVPNYDKNDQGLYMQTSNKHFPFYTWDPQENLEPTFYTKEPPTSEEMNLLIKNNGGNGIVVSLYECMQKYSEIKKILLKANISIPSDPRKIFEWSLIMALTGVMNAVDRKLIDEFDEIIIHASGIYVEGDYQQLSKEKIFEISTADEIFNAINV